MPREMSDAETRALKALETEIAKGDTICILAKYLLERSRDGSVERSAYKAFLQISTQAFSHDFVASMAARGQLEIMRLAILAGREHQVGQGSAPFPQHPASAPPPPAFRPMTAEDLRGLEVGDVVQNRSGRGYVVTGNYGGRATAVDTADITNPPEWELVAKAHRQPRG